MAEYADAAATGKNKLWKWLLLVLTGGLLLLSVVMMATAFQIKSAAGYLGGTSGLLLLGLVVLILAGVLVPVPVCICFSYYLTVILFVVHVIAMLLLLVGFLDSKDSGETGIKYRNPFTTPLIVVWIELILLILIFPLISLFGRKNLDMELKPSATDILTCKCCRKSSDPQEPVPSAPNSA